jgi:hypothetical protein
MKTNTPANKTAQSIAPTASQMDVINRLARQLKESPELVFEKLLEVGISNTDWNLSAGCEPFEAGDDEFNATEAMAGLTDAQIDQLESNGEFAQSVLFARQLNRKRATALVVV